MKKVNYYKIIHKYIQQDSKFYPIYITHVTLVTYKALKIADKLNLSLEQKQFIEEAAMLHDIGIIKVDDPDLFCYGKLEYIAHGVEGRKILESEGLPRHALVAERHTGIGIFKDEIIANDLPLPTRDMLACTIEGEIISFADLFFSKSPGKFWREKTLNEARQGIERFSPRHVKIFDEWAEHFGG